MIRWDLIPISKATNSYDLFDEIAEVILEEPRRVVMDTISMPFDAGRKYTDRSPECGTQGCILGWGMYITASRDARTHNGGYAQSQHKLGSLGWLAKYLPDSVRRDADKLFFGGVYNPEYPWPNDKEIPFGTDAYAAAVVANIRKFQKKNDRALKNHTFRAVQQ